MRTTRSGGRVFGAGVFRAQHRGRDLLMFVDNVGVLAQLTKGSSSAEDPAPLVGTIHLLLAHFSIRVWWEYVDSPANCSDGLSRLFGKDPLGLSSGWEMKRAELPKWEKTLLPTRATLAQLCQA